MFRRLCLFLLMIGLAVPATGAPLHCAPVSVMPMVASHAHGGMPHRQAPESPPAKHDCIGCAAPFMAPPGPEAVGIPPLAREPILDEVRLAGETPGPEMPPPRA